VQGLREGERGLRWRGRGREKRERNGEEKRESEFAREREKGKRAFKKRKNTEKQTREGGDVHF